jgi:hypothetical protein
MSDRRELAENLRIRIRELEAEVAELSAELRKVLQPNLSAVPSHEESSDG